jgi:hypothetical protein
MFTAMAGKKRIQTQASYPALSALDHSMVTSTVWQPHRNQMVAQGMADELQCWPRRRTQGKGERAQITHKRKANAGIRSVRGCKQ